MILLSLPVFLATALAMAVSIVGTVGAFILFRRFVPFDMSEDIKNVGTWGALRIGTIHALILALVFIEVRQEYNDLKETIENEALAIEQLYRELSRVNSEEAHTIQQQLTSYIRIVIDQEWASLASDGPSKAADTLVGDIRQSISNLPPGVAPPLVAAALMDDINDVENACGQRSFDIVEPVATILWIIMILGFLFTSLCFFAYRATPFHCAVLAMFAAINGAVFYSIVALTHPFVGGAAVTPTAFEVVFKRTFTAH